MTPAVMCTASARAALLTCQRCGSVHSCPTRCLLLVRRDLSHISVSDTMPTEIGELASLQFMCARCSH